MGLGFRGSPQPPLLAITSSAPGQDALGWLSRLRRSISAASTLAGALLQLCSCADSASRPPSQLAARASLSLPRSARLSGFDPDIMSQLFAERAGCLGDAQQLLRTCVRPAVRGRTVAEGLGNAPDLTLVPGGLQVACMQLASIPLGALLAALARIDSCAESGRLRLPIKELEGEV